MSTTVFFILSIVLTLGIIVIILSELRKKPAVVSGNIRENISGIIEDIETQIKQEHTKRIIKTTILYIFLSFAAFFVVVPFYWMIISSLKSIDEISRAVPTIFPKKIIWQNYVQAMTMQNTYFGRYMINTIIVGVIGTLGTLVTTVLAAFAFSRLNFKGRDALFAFFLSTMMIPGEMMVISNYVTVSEFGWLANGDWLGLIKEVKQFIPATPTEPAKFDRSFYFLGFLPTPWLNDGTYAALIIPFWTSFFYVYLLRQNFKQIPDELYYAAKVDGTSDFKYLRKVMIPIALPTIITISILKTMGAWNAYVWPNLVTKDKMRLITNGLRTAFKSDEGRSDLQLQMAATTVVTAPLLLVFIFLRKYIMRGVSRSGIKG